MQHGQIIIQETHTVIQYAESYISTYFMLSPVSHTVLLLSLTYTECFYYI